jgi:hypothetical protein
LDNDLAIALYHAQCISDPQWFLHSVLSGMRKFEFQKIGQTSLANRMRSAIMKIGRFHEALSLGNMLESAFWLQSSSYDYSDCLAILTGHPPSPSHIMTQMREYSRGENGDSFRVWSEALGMDMATSAGVKRRLKTMATILKPLRKLEKCKTESNGYWNPRLTLSSHYLELVAKKVRHLVGEHKVVEAYSYIGREIVHLTEELYASYCIVKNIDPSYPTMFTALGSDRSIFSFDISRMFDFSIEAHVLRNSEENLRKLIRLIGHKLG